MLSLFLPDDDGGRPNCWSLRRRGVSAAATNGAVQGRFRERETRSSAYESAGPVVDDPMENPSRRTAPVSGQGPFWNRFAVSLYLKNAARRVSKSGMPRNNLKKIYFTRTLITVLFVLSVRYCPTCYRKHTISHPCSGATDERIFLLDSSLWNTWYINVASLNWIRYGTKLGAPVLKFASLIEIN